jgi:hypothetical protein
MDGGGGGWAGAVRLSSFMHLSGPSRAIKFLNHLPPTLHSMGPDTSLVKLFGLQMALAYQLDAISQGPKTFDFQGPTPSHSLS